MSLGLMPQIKSENPWGLSHLTSAYTTHFAAQVAAATTGGVGYGNANNETTLHHLSSSPSGAVHHQQQQHSSSLQDLQNPMSATSTGSPSQHQQ